MSVFDNSQLDVLSRAFERALEALPHCSGDDSVRRAILRGLVEAAGKGIRDEDLLTDCALAKVMLYDEDSMTEVMREAPL